MRMLLAIVLLSAGCRAVPTAANFDFPDAEDGVGADTPAVADGADVVPVGTDAADDDGQDVSDASEVADVPDVPVVVDVADVTDAPDTVLAPDAPDSIDATDAQPDACTSKTWYQDSDGDGYGSAAVSKAACSKPAGYGAVGTDCDDANSAIHPGTQEVCNGKDDNCNGQTDEGVTATLFADKDGDGYGNASVSQTVCSVPGGYVSNNSDCDDNNSSAHPGATEACNGLDDNCNGQSDEGLSTAAYYQDADGDGYGNPEASQTWCAQPVGYVTDNTDCIDSNGAVHPGAVEVCNGLDDDCNGQTDEGLTAKFYQDKDADGYGDGTVSKTACGGPTGYVSNNSDCNDANAAVHPGATEICDGLDENCNGQTDEGLATATYFQDADGDGYGGPAVSKVWCAPPIGYVADGADCDDASAAVHPGAAEVCNGIDDNCDGATDEGVNCGDGNDCTADTCAGVSGCAHVALANDATCSDGLACTTESCQAGVCAMVMLTCEPNESCVEPAGTCGCNHGYLTIAVDGVNICAPDFPVWGSRPESPPSTWFVDNLDGTVSDTQSLLVWQKADSGNAGSWTAGEAYCAALKLGGKTDWRLPTDAEAQTLVDYKAVNPSVPSIFAATTSANFYWTSSVSDVVQSSSQVWAILFKDGYTNYLPPVYPERVRCARSTPSTVSVPPGSRYQIDVTAGTVFDTLTKLTWQRDGTASGDKTWIDASDYCTGLSLGTPATGWRLPTIVELASLVDRAEYHPAIDATAFPGTPTQWFWSSTLYHGSSDRWYVNFADGENDSESTNWPIRVRCVR
jgi:hypothetical protein